MEQAEYTRKMAKVFAKAWLDEEFKRRLLSAPALVLEEAGITFPPGVEVRMLENTREVQYLVLPNKPADTELSEEMLADVAAGGIVEMPMSCPTVPPPRF
jgi:hypothetical protein